MRHGPHRILLFPFLEIVSGLLAEPISGSGMCQPESAAERGFFGDDAGILPNVTPLELLVLLGSCIGVISVLMKLEVPLDLTM